jgi:mannan endo-1,4-beta-mannosidase
VLLTPTRAIGQTTIATIAPAERSAHRSRPAISLTFFLMRYCKSISLVPLLLLVSCGSASVPPSPEPAPDRPGFRVEGRRLYDRCGEEVVLRGINRMTVVKDRTGIPSFPEIARTGANTVRIMWMMWRPAAEVGEAVGNAVGHGLIPILEMHDATGKWHLLDQVVDYWLQPDMLDVIRRYEQDLIVNIANEAGDHSVTDDQFRDGYRQAIRRMRAAGIRTPLMIDAAGWGRDEAQLLRVAPWLLEQDPERNLIFSWHPWDPGDQEQRITQAMQRSIDLDLPFVIGEFSHTTVGCAGNVPFRHIMAEAQRLGIGWLAWSWGPGNADCPTMDMTTDSTFETLHGWGLEVAVTDPNSIRNTSVRPHSIVHGQCRGA